MRFTILILYIVLELQLVTWAQKNVLLICVDDLRPELRSFGVDYIHSPNIDKLASEGRSFFRHYVQAPTCGASRYTLLTGRYGPGGNGALFDRAEKIAKDPDSVVPSMPAWFRNKGYTTVSVGKVSHHPGGRGGQDWNDSSIFEMPLSWDRHISPDGAWQHPRGAMHGLAHGETRLDAADMDVHQSVEGPNSIYPDGLIVEEGLNQMEQLAFSGKPFFLAVGIIRPHLPFGAPANYMKYYENADLPQVAHYYKPEGRTTWHRSNEYMKYNKWGRNPNEDPDFAIETRMHYAACVTYADALVGKLLGKLEDLGLKDDTVVVLWGDHGWHLGEHAIWGKHALFEESLLSPMVIAHSRMKHAGKSTRAMVETLDIFPTLCDLIGLDQPEGLHGSSLVPILDDPEQTGHPAIGYFPRAGRTIRTDTYRLIVHDDGFTELYDHRLEDAETVNLAAANGPLVKSLLAQLESRLSETQ